MHLDSCPIRNKQCLQHPSRAAACWQTGLQLWKSLAWVLRAKVIRFAAHLALCVDGKHKEAVNCKLPHGLIWRKPVGDDQLSQALRQRGRKWRKLRHRPLWHLLQCLSHGKSIQCTQLLIKQTWRHQGSRWGPDSRVQMSSLHSLACITSRILGWAIFVREVGQHLHQGWEEGATRVQVCGGQALQAEDLADVARHLILGQRCHQIGVHLRIFICDVLHTLCGHNQRFTAVQESFKSWLPAKLPSSLLQRLPLTASGTSYSCTAREEWSCFQRCVTYLQSHLIWCIKLGSSRDMQRVWAWRPTVRFVQVLDLHFQHEVHDERVEAVQQLRVGCREAEAPRAQHAAAPHRQLQQAREEHKVRVVGGRLLGFDQPLQPPQHLCCTARTLASTA